MAIERPQVEGSTVQASTSMWRERRRDQDFFFFCKDKVRTVQGASRGSVACVDQDGQREAQVQGSIAR